MSVCPIPVAQNGAFHSYGYRRTVIGNPMLEVEPTGSGRYGDETVADAAQDYIFNNVR